MPLAGAISRYQNGKRWPHTPSLPCVRASWSFLAHGQDGIRPAGIAGEELEEWRVALCPRPCRTRSVAGTSSPMVVGGAMKVVASQDNATGPAATAAPAMLRRAENIVTPSIACSAHFFAQFVVEQARHGYAATA